MFLIDTDTNIIMLTERRPPIAWNKIDVVNCKNVIPFLELSKPSFQKLFGRLIKVANQKMTFPHVFVQEDLLNNTRHTRFKIIRLVKRTYLENVICTQKFSDKAEVAILEEEKSSPYFLTKQPFTMQVHIYYKNYKRTFLFKKMLQVFGNEGVSKMFVALLFNKQS